MEPARVHGYTVLNPVAMLEPSVAAPDLEELQETFSSFQLLDLPLLIIFRCFRFAELGRLTQVCKSWNSVIQEHLRKVYTHNRKEYYSLMKELNKSPRAYISNVKASSINSVKDCVKKLDFVFDAMYQELSLLPLHRWSEVAAMYENITGPLKTALTFSRLYQGSNPKEGPAQWISKLFDHSIHPDLRLASEGDIDEALELAAGFAELTRKIPIWVLVCPRLVKAGKLRQALEVSSWIPPLHEARSEALYEIVLALLDIGSKDQAIGIAHSIFQEKTKAEAYASIAIKFSQEESIEVILQFVDSISEERIKKATWSLITPELVKMKRIDEALEIIKLMPNKWGSFRVFNAYVVRGNMKKAIQTFTATHLNAIKVVIFVGSPAYFLALLVAKVFNIVNKVIKKL